MIINFKRSILPKLLYIDGYNPNKETYMINNIKKSLNGLCKVIHTEIDESTPIKSFNILKKLSNSVDLILGFSMGGFYTELLKSNKKIFINPAFRFYEIVKFNSDKFNVDIDELEYLSKKYRFKSSNYTNKSVMILGDLDYKIKSTNVIKDYKLYYNGTILNYNGGHIIDEISMKNLIPKSFNIVMS